MGTQSTNISISNDPFSTPASSDGIGCLIMQAATVSTTFVLGNMYLLTKSSDLTTLGITAANNPATYKQVTEFYLQAGDGAKLWLYGVADNTAFATFLASDTAKVVVRNSYVADPLNGIKNLAIGYKIPAAGQTSADFPTDVTASIPLFQAMIVALRAEGYFIKGIIDGYNMSSTVTPSTLGTRASDNSPSVAVCIDGTDNTRVSSIGQLLGKLARISIGTSIKKVADGAIYGTARYLTNQTNIDDLTPTDITSLGNKQYVFARKQNGKTGYYYNDGATCTATSNSLSTLEYNSIGVHFAYESFIYWTNEIGTNLPVDENGDLAKSYISAKQSDFKSKYIDPYIASGDISNGQMLVSGIDYVTNKTVTWKIEVQPAPALSTVNGSIVFVQSLTA